MILICGGLADTVTELVCSRLESRRLTYRFLDLTAYPGHYRVCWTWMPFGIAGFIAGPDWRLDLTEISGVFVRYPGPEACTTWPGEQDGSAAAFHAEHQFGLAALLEDWPCRVVNRMGEGFSNHSKPLQALALRAEGLMIPQTLVTDDPAAARAFIEAHGGEVIFKSLSGIRSVVQRVEPRHIDRLPLLRHGPGQFQELVPGENVRVHTVGNALFATRIRSDVVDYRYAQKFGKSVAMEATELGADCARACFAITRRLGLEMAGIDLKQTPDGRTYCFEVNPAPGFLYYERNSGQPISDALADLLAGRQERVAVPEQAGAGT